MSGDQPILPYGGEGGENSGWSGSDTSRERAERDDTTGVTSVRQRAILRHLAAYGETGVTYFELGQRMGMHHGQSSGALSNLHKGGAIARLVERRHGCHVYVLPEFVGERATQPPGRVARPGLGPVAAEMARILNDIVARGWVDTDNMRDANRIVGEYARIVRQ